MQRKVIGDPKSGLALQVEHTPDVLAFVGRPDPLLLEVVLGVLVCVGIFGSIAASPREGILGFFLLAFLFFPLICVLTFNAVRVRTRCVLDKPSGVVRIDERSYTRRVRESYALDQIDSVAVRRMPSAPLTGDALTYGVFLALPHADYLLAASTNEHAIGQDALRVSRFLSIPFEVQNDDDPVPARTRVGLLVTLALVYLLPIVIATAVLVFILDQLPRVEPSLIGLLGAVVISQLGAIIAYAYYRARRPYGG